MATANVVAVGEAAVLLSAPTGTRRRVTLRVATGGGPVFLGSSGVTATTGLGIADTDTTPLTLSLGESEPLYGICAAAGSASVQVLTT